MRSLVIATARATPPGRRPGPRRRAGGPPGLPRHLPHALALLLLAASAAAGESPLTAIPGDLPILLTAPHDGGGSLAGLPPRGNREGRADFLTVRDLGTAALLTECAAAIERRAGRRPYVVVNGLSRLYMDPNRTPGRGAFEHPRGGAAWRAYHAAVARFRRDIRRRFGAGVLADLHGHASRPADVYVGTRGGATIPALAALRGREAALAGPGSLAARLAAAGFALPGFAAEIRTDLPLDRKLPRPIRARIPPFNPPRLNGGGTVTLHGLARRDALDAYQIEAHRRVRLDPAARARLADALAEALLDPALNPGMRAVPPGPRIR